MISSLNALARFRPPAGIKIISFDVFDTLLARKVDPPKYLKELAARNAVKRLSLPIEAHDLLTRRLRVEAAICRSARERGEDEEFSISQVYECLCAGDSCLSGLSDRLMSLELEVEQAYCALMPHITNFLEELSSNYRLIAISDTYLPGSFLCALLKKCKIADFFGGIYASCDYGCNKGSGKLFTEILALEGCGPQELLHFGDNLLSDYFMPRSLGINAVLLLDGKNLHRKARLSVLNDLVQKSSLWKGQQILEGITLLPATRYRHQPQSLLHEWGKSIVGPLVTLFIHELCLRLSRSPVKEVYFLAREGYLLKRVYDRFNRSLFSGRLPPGRYLCISRSTAYLASLGDFGEWNMDLLLQDFSLNLRDVLHRLGIEDEADIDVIAAAHGMSPDLCDKGQIRAVLNKLKCDDSFREKIGTRSGEMRALLTAYLEGEGFFSGHKVALVDIGWYGSIQDCLERVFTQIGKRVSLYGYYLGLDHRCSAEYGDKSGLLHDFRSPTMDGVNLTFFRLAFEFSCRAGHGTTVGYRLHDGSCRPVFRMDATESASYRQIRCIQYGMVDFADDYIAMACIEGVQPAEMAPAFLAHYHRKISFPDQELVASFDSVLNSDDYASDRNRAVTGVMRFSDILAPAKLYRNFIETPWRDAALCRMRVPLVPTAYCIVKRYVAIRRIKIWSRQCGSVYSASLTGFLRILCRWVQFQGKLWYRCAVQALLNLFVRFLKLFPSGTSLSIVHMLIRLKNRLWGNTLLPRDEQ